MLASVSLQPHHHRSCINRTTANIALHKSNGGCLKAAFIHCKLQPPAPGRAKQAVKEHNEPLQCCCREMLAHTHMVFTSAGCIQPSIGLSCAKMVHSAADQCASLHTQCQS